MELAIKRPSEEKIFPLLAFTSILVFTFFAAKASQFSRSKNCMVIIL